MLYTHLFFLAFTSFVPGDSLGVSFKKECLREKSRKEKVVSTQSDMSLLLAFLGEADHERQTEIKVCSVKLFCTAATETITNLTPPLVSKAIAFHYKAYHSVAASREPDPPKFC